MAGLETGINILETIFFKTGFSYQFWLMQLTVVFASLVLITRKTSDWRSLGLPILVGWHYFGINFSWIFYGIAGILFVIDVLSIETITGAIGSVKQTFSNLKDQNGIKDSYKNYKQEKTLNKERMKTRLEDLSKGIDLERLKRTDRDAHDDIETRKKYRRQLRDEEILEKEFPILAKKKKNIRIKDINEEMGEQK